MTLLAGLLAAKNTAIDSPFWRSARQVAFIHPDLTAHPTGTCTFVQFEKALLLLRFSLMLSAYSNTTSTHEPFLVVNFMTFTGTLTRMGSTIYFVMRATSAKKTEVPTHPVSALNNTNLGPLYAVTGPHHGMFHCTVSVHNSVSRS